MYKLIRVSTGLLVVHADRDCGDCEQLPGTYDTWDEAWQAVAWREYNEACKSMDEKISRVK